MWCWIKHCWLLQQWTVVNSWMTHSFSIIRFRLSQNKKWNLKDVNEQLQVWNYLHVLVAWENLWMRIWGISCRGSRCQINKWCADILSIDSRGTKRDLRLPFLASKRNDLIEFCVQIVIDFGKYFLWQAECYDLHRNSWPVFCISLWSKTDACFSKILNVFRTFSFWISTGKYWIDVWIERAACFICVWDTAEFIRN